MVSHRAKIECTDTIKSSQRNLKHGLQILLHVTCLVSILFNYNENAAEFFLFYQYCRELEFDQDPDYGYLHRLLKDRIYAESFNY